MSSNGAPVNVPPFPPDYRASGLLLHITSLPSPYGIGDLGSSAFSWLDRLHDAGQRWWQALPLGPTGYGNSPYQPMSSFAGNGMLISPGSLILDGLLKASDCEADFAADVVDYEAVIPFKVRFLETAWKNFNAGERKDLRPAYDEFCVQQEHWLEDYALFRALKAKYHGAYFLDWSPELVQRNEDALASARRELASQIDQVRFAQFLLFRQGDQLKEHAHSKGVALIGDLPFFVSPDSSDVWANPELFLLDEHRRPRFVAGVPPDYFSAQGQLWGNPVYNWDALRATGYRPAAFPARSRGRDSPGSLPRVRGCLARSRRRTHGSVRTMGAGAERGLLRSGARRTGSPAVHRRRSWAYYSGRTCTA
jgi:4-alpha-glucanotransferase